MTELSPPGPAVEPRLRELLGGILALRLLVWCWALLVVIIDARSHTLANPRLAAALLTVALGWILLLAGLWQWAPRRMVRPDVIAADLVIAATLVIADYRVYAGDHAQSFGSALPIAAVISTGVISGAYGGAASGAVLGLTSIAGAGLYGSLSGRGIALTGSMVLLIASGLISGYVSVRLRHADSAVAAAKAQQTWARTLHDGVLQTLAVIQRRSEDPELVALARSQEQELRALITEDEDRPNSFAARHGDQSVDVVSSLRQHAARADATHGLHVQVVVIEGAQRPAAIAEALAAAAGEALANCAKHADASTITLCVDNDERGVVITVNDDGIGFDPSTMVEGTGLTHSIRSRLAEVQGGAELRSAPGRGTEVELWVP